MRVTAFGIVLSRIKYGDTSVIAKVYTQKYGQRSFLVKGVRKRKSKIPFNLFNPFSVLEIVFLEKQNREINLLLDAKAISNNQLLSLEAPRRSAIAYFLSEAFSGALHEGESDETTFNFLINTIDQLSDLDKNFAGFAPKVLWQFTRQLGILPSQEFNGKFFHIPTGDFNNSVFGEYQIDEKYSAEIKRILGESDEENQTIISSNTQLKIVLDYYSYHLSYFKIPKSIEVLKEIFK